jgi:hypothetical protein
MFDEVVGRVRELASVVASVGRMPEAGCCARMLGSHRLPTKSEKGQRDTGNGCCFGQLAY